MVEKKKAAEKPKLTLLAENLFIIRETKHSPDKKTSRVMYYVTPSSWDASPMEATIFQSMEAGETHLAMLRERDYAPWADGSVSHFDVVPMFGAIVTGGK